MMDLTPFREQLAAEIARCRGRADALQTVLDAAEAVPGDPGVPMVRPPAEGVPQPPVELPKPPAKREATPAAATARGKHDWPAIAEEMKRAAVAGEPIARALAAKFGVNTTTAGWMMGRCRELGLVEYVRQPKTPRKPMAAVSPPAPSAEERLAAEHADTIITTARAAVVDEPAKPDRHSAPGNPSVFARTTKVLACAEDGCEFTCDPDRAIDLRTHAVGAHGRRPTDEERTPVVRGAAA